MHGMIHFRIHPMKGTKKGGWIYFNSTLEIIETRRASAGGTANLDLCDPSIIDGTFVVATFHTHPNPTSEGWDDGPSDSDTSSAWLLGVP
jgi:hypothetical protein